MSIEKYKFLSPSAKELFRLLSEIAQKGFIPAIGRGDTSIGMTLLNELGLEFNPKGKQTFNEIAITARRVGTNRASNRVNVLTTVPDWPLSNCKSSKEICEKYGYLDDGKMKLNCTVSSKSFNSQGLFLKVDFQRKLVIEFCRRNGKNTQVAAWDLSRLEKVLKASRSESVWVGANSRKKDKDEYFHFREAVYSGRPYENLLGTLIDEGTVSLDHMINAGREKGPTFKIRPENIEMLFPRPKKINLMSL